MDKSEALKEFYQKNHIDIHAVTNEMDGNYDRRIANLSAQVDVWLSNIDPKDHEFFLTLLSRYHYLTEVCCQQRYCRILDMLEKSCRPNVALRKFYLLQLNPAVGLKQEAIMCARTYTGAVFPKLRKDKY